MYKLYNTQQDFASTLNDFLKNSVPFIRKTQLNILPHIIWGMILSESSVASDIAKHIKGPEFDNIGYNSKVKRIRRFYNNDLFDSYSFYDSIIRFVIANYKKKHKDNRVHIIIDHMFSHNNYTVLMISMRIGQQGIPLWFRCFKGKPDDAYRESLILEGINYVIDLFKDKSYNLIFLADRWFNSVNLMKFIENAGHTFVFRLKKNIKAFIYDKKEKHKVWKWLDEITNYEYHSVCYDDILLTDDKYNCKLVYSKRHGTNDPWILATNGDYKHTIIDYGYRYGGVETLFKNQKSNGFYIEAVNNATEKSFTTMYTLVCTAVLFLTILGCEYSKNTKTYKNTKIETHKNYKDKGKIRVMSLFQTGLTLFKLAINSFKYIYIPVRFILYDI